MAKKKSGDKYTDLAKETVKVGLVTATGGYAVGALGGLAGPSAQPAVRATQTGLNLAAVGQLAKVGLNLLPEPKKGKKTKSKEVNKILGL